MKSIVVIPARLESSRLPNKVILDLCGKPLIQRVYERVGESRYIDDIYVATDSGVVAKVVEEFGGNVIMTSSKHQSGTDRIAEAVKSIDADLIINVQGDEPMIESTLINSFVELFKNDYEVYFASAMHKIGSKDDLNNPNVVKVIKDKQDNAIYFSRSKIPFTRDGEIEIDNYYQHIGIYAYKKPFLLEYSQLEPTFLEESEKLEQLRAIENGYKIRMVESDYRSVGVDTIEDFERVKKLCRECKDIT